jgi:hypothetical protein
MLKIGKNRSRILERESFMKKPEEEIIGKR